MIVPPLSLFSLSLSIPQAVEMIESLTNIQMPLRTDEPYFILFRKEQNVLVCGSSYIGRKDSFANVGQPVFISLSPSCGLGTGKEEKKKKTRGE